MFSYVFTKVCMSMTCESRIRLDQQQINSYYRFLRLFLILNKQKVKRKKI